MPGPSAGQAVRRQPGRAARRAAGSSRLRDASSCLLQRRTCRARKPSGRPKSPSPTVGGVDRVQVRPGCRPGARAIARVRSGPSGASSAARPVRRAVDPLHHVERRPDHRLVGAQRIRRPAPGRAVPCSAVITRYSRPMSWAVASTCPSGGRRTTQLARAVGDLVGQVRLAAGDQLCPEGAVQERRCRRRQPGPQGGHVQTRRVVGHASHTTLPDRGPVGEPLHARPRAASSAQRARPPGADHALRGEPDSSLVGGRAPAPGRLRCRGPSAGRGSSSS